VSDWIKRAASAALFVGLDRIAGVEDHHPSAIDIAFMPQIVSGDMIGMLRPFRGETFP